MKIRALLITSENRGDHAADIYEVFDVLPSETVEQLIERCKLTFTTDTVELKIVREA